MVGQTPGNYNTTGGYRPSELVSIDDRNPVNVKNQYIYEGADLTPHPIGGLNALRDYLVGLEGGGDYSAANRHGALGAYQMLPDALKQSKYQDADGRWTGKDGVWSKEDFLGNKTAQDNAFASNVDAVKAQLKSNGAWSHIGETLPDGTIITEGSLIGAGWLGAGNVGNYFKDGADRTDANGASIGYRLRSFSRFDPSLPEASGTDDVVDTPRTPYKTDGTTTYHHTPEGEYDGVTLTNIAKGESFALGIKVEKGDTITQVFDATGTKITYLSVTHTVGNETTVTERSTDPATGEPILSTSTWVGSGPGSLQTQYQLGLDGEPVGDRYVEDGEVYTRSTAADGTTQWRNERNQTEQEWRLDPTNPHSINATNGMDLEDISARTSTTTPTPTPTQNTTPVGYKTVEQDGQTYAVTDKGTLERPVPGHPGWLEQRDSTGGGIISDDKGTPVAQLLPGDRVGMMDDTRITVHDTAGKAVNRSVDGDVPAEFAPTPDQVAHFRMDQVAALNPQNNATNSTSDGSEDEPQSLDAVNGSDLQSDQTSAAIASAQSQAEVKAYDQSFAASNNFNNMVHNWEHMDDAQRITGLLTLYNQIDTLPTGSTNTTTDTATTLDADGKPTGQAKAGDNLPGSASTALNWVNIANSVNSLSQWDKMSDVAHLTATLSLYTQASGATNGGLNGAGYAGEALGYINLAQSIDRGDTAGTIAALNAVSNQAIDGAINSALGSSGVPYVGILLALNDFDKHPGQSIGALVGMYFGPIGSMLGSMIGSMVDEAFGPHPAPPQPIGEVHFEWSAGVVGLDGHAHSEIQIAVDANKNKGADAAKSVAGNVLGMLEQMVDALNAQTLQQHPDTPTSDLLAINPNLLPRMGYTYNHSTHKATTWMEVTQPDGSTTHESLSQENLAQRLLEVLTDNGGLAPQWLVETQEAHFHQMVESGADGATLSRELHAGQGGHASTGNQAFALQGNAVESADFKSQSFGALVVHTLPGGVHERCNQALQDTIEQLTTIDVLRDVENDGFMEHTQWVAGSADLGHTQGMLIIDFNHNNLIETQDILNLGGNAADTGNLTDEAIASRANADLQRNNVQWLDANADGVLDSHDPAFAAIKLWVDSNNDGFMQSGESQGLAALQIAALNFHTGEVTYADGHTALLTAHTLHADTEGMRLTQIQEVVLDENGVAQLHTLNAGTVLEHEGYVGQVQTTDDGGTRWGAVRKGTFEQEAISVGDWEGSSEQALHRHGGGNVLTDGSPAPKQTMATAAVSIKPDSSKVAGGAAIAFVPTGQTSASDALRIVTREMIQNAESTLFSGVGASGASLGALAAVGAGMVGASANAMAGTGNAERGGSDDGDNGNDGSIWITSDASAASLVSAPLSTLTPTSAALSQWGAWDANGAFVFTPSPVFKAAGNTSTTPVSTTVVASADADTRVSATLHTTLEAVRALGQKAAVAGGGGDGAALDTSDDADDEDNTKPLGTLSSCTGFDAGGLALEHPVITGETLPGTEDTALVMTPAMLLGNDTSANQVANPNQAALSISAVGDAVNGYVAIVNGNVVFVPNLNFNGTASFSYTVTDQYGLTGTATATLQIAAVNDAPTTLGETIHGALEDQALLIMGNAMLANDTDVDNLQSSLALSRVQSGTGGTVSLNGAGNVVFTPTLNFNGAATFTYWVVDPSGLESAPITTTVLITAINDAPTALGESLSGALEDAVFTVPLSLLTANDSDVDDVLAATPDPLSMAWVGNATGGTVAINSNGDVVFTPTANFNGNATFDYRIRDAAGLESATVQAVIAVAALNDAPIAVDDLFSTYVDSVMTIGFTQLTGNDSDVDGDALTVSAVRNNTNGVASLVGGQVQFVATPGYIGAASFDYLSDDGHGGQTWATAFVDVKPPPNLYPTIDVYAGSNSNVWHGGSAYYNPVEVWQNFTYVLHDESAGSVSIIITARDSGNLTSAPAANSFQYHIYDGWGADGVSMNFDITLTDQQGVVNTAHVYTDYDLGAIGGELQHFYVTLDHTGYYVAPVLIDLMNDGFTYQAASTSPVRFDMNADGTADHIAWVGNDDGVLVWDKDHNGQISDASEFSFATLKPGAHTDLEGLQALDTNHNGLLDGGDATWGQFGVWQDKDGNGKTDAGEFKTLDQLGFASINLHSNAQMHEATKDVTVMGDAAFTRTDGSTGAVADAMLAYVPAEVPTVILEQHNAAQPQADINRMALLFNQMVNTASTDYVEPLGFVPMQADTAHWVGVIGDGQAVAELHDKQLMQAV